MKVQNFCVPILITLGVKTKKNYYLNLNGYRNWQFRLSNDLKRKFKEQVKDEIAKLTPVEGSCKMTFAIFYPTKRLFDVDNIASVVTKFTNDALVELNILAEDNYLHVTEIHSKFGGIDRDNPRCEVTIMENPDGKFC